MKFGEKLKILRQQKGLTQEELAKQAGITSRTVIHYENGDSLPRKSEVYKNLAKVLGTTEDELRSEDELFLTHIGETYGLRGAKQAEYVLKQAAALFAGGELSEDDQLAFIHEIQSLYLDSKERSKKFTPKKYLKDETGGQ
ncbi:MAG: helix-turn-helix domain-containing protein [Eubacteriales bacterium]|nr:helix-turn-helix domain-containing protein [Eubacteriales bacterium]